jgi:signal peptidase II
MLLALPGHPAIASHRHARITVVPTIVATEPWNAKRRLVAMIAAVVVAVDAVTKAIAAHALAGRGIVDVWGGAFHLELYRNAAGPGNLLRGHPVLVSVLSMLAVALIATAAWSVRTTSFAVALGLLLGGGIGNLVDRLLGAPGPLRGGVIDWIKPTLSSGSLNLADLSINAAVIAVLVALALDWYRHARRQPGSDSAQPEVDPPTPA